MAGLANVETRRPLEPGVYVPTVAFFHPDSEDVDLQTVQKHAIRLAEAGVAGIAVQGSNGEAVHISNKERNEITSATRKALDDGGFSDLPVIVGAGGQSTRLAIFLAQQAALAGGDYILVLPPSYYRAMVPRPSLLQHFTDIADASPLPLLIYNYPGVAGGIDLTADDIITLSQHPKIVGCKLTCGNVGKLQRISFHHLRGAQSDSPGFMSFGGMADLTVPAMIAGGSGVIAGLANVAPKACVKVYDLFTAGKFDEAKKIQGIVAKGDWGTIFGGIPGTKCALQSYFGYGGVGRRPLPQPNARDQEAYSDLFREVIALERSL